MTYQDLSENDKRQLIKFPAYISLLAANADGQMNDEEKKKAIEFTHIKTYSSERVLADFYKDAALTFQQSINELDNQLPKGKTERESQIKREIEKLQPILNKLGKEYKANLKSSMDSYVAHVSKAHGNLLVSFLIPFVDWS